MKIRTKNFLYTSGIIVLVITVAFSMLYFLMPRYYQYQKEQQIKDVTKNIIEKIDIKSNETDIAKIISEESFYNNMTIYLKDTKGETIYPKTVTGHWESAVFNDELGTIVENSDEEVMAKKAVTANDPSDDFKYLSHTEKLKGGYSLTVVYPFQPIDEAQQVLLAIYPYVLTVCFIFGTIGTFLYSHFSTKRIERISKITREMTIADHLIDNEIGGQDEISQLAKDIQYLHTNLVQTNKKLSQDLLLISDLENAKAEFMQIASHELKTPITALSGIIEGMIYNVGVYKDRDKYLEVCQSIIQEQTALIKDILYTSKLDQIENQEIENFMLDELILEELPKLEPFILEKNYQLKINLLPLEVTANKEDIRNVVKNLLSNTMKYTSNNGEIKVDIIDRKLQIQNECQILDNHDLDRIFEAFYRPDFARNRKDGGTGLGLYIVSQLLEKNKCDFHFVPSPDSKGMSFEIMFKSH